MKKILAIIISATMLLSLSSCANSNGTSTADRETTNDAVSGEDDGGNSDATKNNPTSREHYVPKVYLNGFASENKRLYFYDLNTRLHSNIMIDVDTICFQRNLCLL